MCLAQRPQRSDAGEAGTRGPSSQALYHWATALPYLNVWGHPKNYVVVHMYLVE